MTEHQIEPSRQPEASDPARVERAGDEAVDAVLADVEAMATDTPLAEQLSRLVEAHDALQRRLTATDG